VRKVEAPEIRAVGTRLEEVSFVIVDPNNVPQDAVFAGGKAVLNSETSRLGGGSSRRLSS